MDDDEPTVDNIVKKLAINLAEYIEEMPTDKLEHFVKTCLEGSTKWFENLLDETACVYAQNELRKRPKNE
jgi:hypothetical protein